MFSSFRRLLINFPCHFWVSMLCSAASVLTLVRTFFTVIPRARWVDLSWLSNLISHSSSWFVEISTLISLTKAFASLVIDLLPFCILIRSALAAALTAGSVERCICSAVLILVSLCTCSTDLRPRPPFVLGKYSMQLIWGRWLLCFCVVEDLSQISIQLFQVVHRPVYNRHVVCQGWQSKNSCSLHLVLFWQWGWPD